MLGGRGDRLGSNEFEADDGGDDASEEHDPEEGDGFAAGEHSPSDGEGGSGSGPYGVGGADRDVLGGIAEADHARGQRDDEHDARRQNGKGVAGAEGGRPNSFQDGAEEKDDPGRQLTAFSPMTQPIRTTSIAARARLSFSCRRATARTTVSTAPIPTQTA
jgi:hypothetical protein